MAVFGGQLSRLRKRRQRAVETRRDLEHGPAFPHFTSAISSFFLLFAHLPSGVLQEILHFIYRMSLQLSNSLKIHIDLTSRRRIPKSAMLFATHLRLI